MEETNLEPGTTDAAAETKTSEEDQQEVSKKIMQFKNYHPNPNVRNNPHLFSYKTGACVSRAQRRNFGRI
ncbi:hypothetical protein F2Q68_00033679 [Brassica cretica]|uniref:Uncharacterized protein n=1 Tax=Brassica cretica TaxID=69181 RepID=A0A8S9H7S5_BRACR|nr:hypothetical protein F2Q68_00033679 [Brassica cretica]